MIGLYNYKEGLFNELTLPSEIDKDTFINAFLLKYGECPVIYPNWGTMQFALGVWSKKWYHSIVRIIEAMMEEYDPLHNFDRHELYTDIEDIDKKNRVQSDTDRTTASQENATNSETIKSTGNSETESSTTEERALGTDTTENGTSENAVSAYNEDGYQPDNKNETVKLNNVVESGSIDTDTSSSTYDSQNGTRNATENRTGSVNDDITNVTNGTDNTDRKLVHEGHLYGNIGVTESTTMLMHEIETRRDNNIIDIVADMLYKEVCIYVY